MKKHILLLLTLILQSLSSAFGQQISYLQLERIHNDTESSITSCFLQDPSGLIWFGSNAGLLSYDGYTAHAHFEYGTENNVRIYCGICIGDCFYLGTDNGILIYNYKTDHYLPAPVSFPADVRSIARQEDRLWIGTFSGLFLYDLNTKRLRQFTPRNSNLPHPTIYSLLLSSDSTLYVGTYNGLCSFDEEKNDFKQINIQNPNEHKNLFINALLEDKEERCIWIGTEGELMKYKPDGKTERIESFHHNSIKSLAFDTEKNLLLGTDNGMYIFDKPTRQITHLRHDSRI